MIECFYGDPTIEYFYSDIILDPVSAEAGRLIGKEVYASLIPARCLMIANGRCKRPYRCFLESIEPESTLPFYVRVVDMDNSESASYKSFPCIIPKKDQAELEWFSFREVPEWLMRTVCKTAIEIRRRIMKHLKHTSDVYSPWRDIGPVPEEALPRNSDAVLEDQDCRSYTLQVIKEGLTEVELKLGGSYGG